MGWLKLNCEYCGKVYMRPNHRAGVSRFCSNACSINNSTTHEIREFDCAGCGKTFSKKIYKNKKLPKFCSRECFFKRPAGLVNYAKHAKPVESAYQFGPLGATFLAAHNRRGAMKRKVSEISDVLLGASATLGVLREYHQERRHRADETLVSAVAAMEKCVEELRKAVKVNTRRTPR